MKKEKIKPGQTKLQFLNIGWSYALGFVGILLGLFLAKVGWEWWSSPYHILQRGPARGQREFLLTELIGTGWKKVCLVPGGEYIWDYPSDEVKDFFNRQFGATWSSNLDGGSTFVEMYVERGKSHEWFFIGERRHRDTKPEDEVAKPPYWDKLAGKNDTFIECTTNQEAVIIIPEDNTVVMKGFGPIFHFKRNEKGNQGLVGVEEAIHGK